MIIDHISKYTRYKNINSAIKAALEFISANSMSFEMSDGKYEIIPGQVTAFIVSKDTMNAVETDMEIHKDFMDIHYILSGEEVCEYGEVPEDIEAYHYDEENDITFFPVKKVQEVHVQQGSFYMVWPYEAHKPLCSVNCAGEKVRKIICKVKL